MPFPVRSSLAVAVAAVCLLRPGAAGAQPTPELTPEPGCSRALALADSQYAERAYAAVEPLLLDCFTDRAATPLETQRAYRLLALTDIKRGRLPQARQAVARLLYADGAYQADPLVDLPVYVDLVADVRKELWDSRRKLPPLRARPPGTEISPKEPGAPLADPPRQPDAQTGRPRVNLNTATAEEIETLPGIGAALAGRIVEFRSTHGLFRDLRDVLRVQGAGDVRIEDIADRVTLR